MEWPDVSQALGSIPHAIVGGVATRAYMPERATANLDVVVLAADARSAGERLRATGFDLRGALSIGESSWRSPDGIALDLIEGSEGWWVEALQAARQAWGPSGSPVLPLNWLVLMKLQASRVQDLADVSRMLGLADASALDDVRRTVARHARALADDLESLITLGKLETRTDSADG